MTDFKTTVTSLSDAINSDSNFTYWIRFSVPTTDGADFVIDTRNPDSNFFMSFSYDKNGSGQCNDFTITIQWIPAPNVNPNSIEAVLLGAMNKECKLQYGYTYPIQLSSPEYTGVLTDYTVDIRDGLISYTFTGYSGVIKSKENEIFVKGASEEDIQRYKSLTSGSVDTLNAYFNPIRKLNIELTKYLSDLYDIEEEPDIAKKVKLFDLTEDFRGTIFEYANWILSRCSDNDDDGSNPDNKALYYYTISDIKNTKGKGTITIKRRPKLSEIVDAETNVTFDWMGLFNGNVKDRSNVEYKKTSNIVTSFSYDYKGAIYLAQSNLDKDKISYGIDDDGNIVITSGDINYTIKTNGKYSSIEDLKNTVVSYKVSQADGMSMPSVKTVRLRDVADVLHHSQGYLLVRVFHRDVQHIVTSCHHIRCDR